MSTPTIPGSESDEYFTLTLIAVDGAHEVSPARLQVTHSPEEDEGWVVVDVTFPEHDPRHESFALWPDVAERLADDLDRALRRQPAAELRGLDTYDLEKEVTLQAAPSDSHPGRVDLRLVFSVSGRTEHVLMCPEVTQRLGQALRDAVGYLRASE